ncbi:hypothetical protein OX283_004200 [Flavobacterium sp. SUN052]|uniref:hypothetical protein n=1 Tax=Flavobacterium sp. SUN052 TaxID=3002441 RepID=UPI00237D369E|nr:hypothetical protein [Flavobacterium sp. SUN052]MEC4003847.1 hypothetical protein [Flavobacterium sp. SUN052]
MKTIAVTIVAIFALSTLQAQNKNVQKTTETKITTIKDSDGEKKIVKTVETNQVQKVELGEEKANTLNIETVPSPVNVVTETKVSVDGVVQSVDIDRSAVYNFDGKEYNVSLDKSGYTITNPSTKNQALLRRTSNNNYIYKTKNKTSVGYFDEKGNLILETYDEKTDKIVLEKYNLMKP